MQFENTLKCHRSFIHLITEQDIVQCGCISLTDGENAIEQKIYLVKTTNEFEVRVYKVNPKDAYVPHVLDFQVKRYEANDQFASFFFDRFFYARRFICTLKEFHPEYNIRPN